MEPLEAVIELYVSEAGFRLNRPFAAVHQSVYWLTRRLFAWWDLDLNNNTYLCPQEKNLPS